MTIDLLAIGVRVRGGARPVRGAHLASECAGARGAYICAPAPRTLAAHRDTQGWKSAFDFELPLRCIYESLSRGRKVFVGRCDVVSVGVWLLHDMHVVDRVDSEGKGGVVDRFRPKKAQRSSCSLRTLCGERGSRTGLRVRENALGCSRIRQVGVESLLTNPAAVLSAGLNPRSQDSDEGGDSGAAEKRENGVSLHARETIARTAPARSSTLSALSQTPCARARGCSPAARPHLCSGQVAALPHPAQTHGTRPPQPRSCTQRCTRSCISLLHPSATHEGEHHD